MYKNMNHYQAYDMTVLIPNYNNAKYLPACLQSIFNQITTRNFIIIIIDDYSTDNSIDVINFFCNQYPDKIHFIKNEKNKGLCEVICDLIKQVNSLYWTILDSNDMWVDNNYFERSINFLEKNTEYVLYSNNFNYLYQNNTYKTANPLEINIGGYDSIKKTVVDFCYSHTSSTVFKNTGFTEQFINMTEKIINNYKQDNNIINTMYCNIYEGDSIRHLIAACYGKTYHDNTIIVSNFRIIQNSRWIGLNDIFKKLLSYMFYVEMYLQLTDFFHMQIFIKDKYLSEKGTSDIYNISLLLDNIKEMKQYKNAYYYKTRLSENDIDKLHHYACNIYELTDVPKKPNRYMFFLPSRYIGGFEQLFVNLALKLSKNGYKVSYIDYENGHFNRLIGHNHKIDLIIYPDNHPHNHTLKGSNFIITHNENVNLIMPFTMSTEIQLNLTKKSNIMYYFAHPKSIEFLIYRSGIHKSNILEHVKSIANNICCQDEVNQQIITNFIDIKSKIIPIIPIIINEPDINYPLKKNIISKNEINIGFMGRLDSDKIFSIKNIIDNLDIYKTSLKKNIHIIGDNNNDSIKLLNLKYYKKKNINIIFSGLKLNEDKYIYLNNNIDIFFGMGTTLLETSFIKIPTVLILAQLNKKFTSDKFIWYNDLININNGFFEENIPNLGPFNFRNFSDILDDIYKYNKFEEIGEKCYNYYINNHESNNIINKITTYFESFDI
jgi:glycosyltransferase involved in cell wall biosynthesis